MNDDTIQQPAAAGFSEEWEQRYRLGTHLSVWPWSDVVAYVHRYAKPREEFNVVLELGCGAGANIPFFVSRGDDYHAIEGSPTMVARLQERFPELADRILAADFTREIPFDRHFDLVLDRSSVTHNDKASIERCLALAAGLMRVGGLFIGIDWFTDEHSDACKGTSVDAHTRSVHGLGLVHFSDRTHLEGLLVRAGFEIIVLERKTGRMLLGEETFVRDVFNFVAVRR